VVWLTTSREAPRDALGLTSSMLDCDRMAYLYRAFAPAAVPWLGSRLRAEAPPDVVTELEAFGEPASWWISTEPVQARLAGVGHGGP
jgi:hypothetical protein